MPIYTKGQAVDFIEAVFGTGTLSNQGLNISVVCPACRDGHSGTYSKKKLVIRTDNFMCHCWVCGYKSRNLVDLLKRNHTERLVEYLGTFVGAGYLYDDIDDEESKPPVDTKLKLPTGFRPLFVVDDQSLYSEDEIKARTECIRYVRKRIPRDPPVKMASHPTLLRRRVWTPYWKFGLTVEDPGLVHRVIMPSYDENGDLNYYVARAVRDGMFPKYVNASVPREDIVFNELMLDWSLPLTIVEGPFDLVRCNTNATCLLGSDLTTDYRLFLKILQNRTEVNLALDPDAFQTKTLKIAELLHQYDIPVNIVTLPTGYKDVGEMPRSEFIGILDHAIPYSKNFLLKAKVAGMFSRKK